MIEEKNQQQNGNLEENKTENTKKEEVKVQNNTEFRLAIGNTEYMIKFSKPKNEENSLLVILVDNENTITEYFQCIYSIEKLVNSCNVFQLFGGNMDEIIKFICKNFEDNKNIVGMSKNNSQFILNMKLINEENKEEQVFSVKMDKIKLNQEEINLKLVQEVKELNKKMIETKRYQNDLKKIIKILVEEIQTLKDDNLFKEDLLTKIILRLNTLESQKGKMKGKKMPHGKNINTNMLGNNINNAPFIPKNLKNPKAGNKDNSQMYGIDYGYSERADESFISSMSNLNLCKDMENRINVDIENMFKDTESEFNLQDSMLDKRGKKNVKVKNPKKKKVNKYELKNDNVNYDFPQNQNNPANQNNLNNNTNNDNVSSQIMKIINSGGSNKGFIPKSIRNEQQNTQNNNKTETEDKNDEQKNISIKLSDIIQNNKQASYIPKFMRKNVTDTNEKNNTTNTANTNTNQNINNNTNTTTNNVSNNELKVNTTTDNTNKKNEITNIPKKEEPKKEDVKKEDPKDEEPKVEEEHKKEKSKKDEVEVEVDKKDKANKEKINNDSDQNVKNDADPSQVEKIQVIKIAKNTPIKELDSKIITDQKELDLIENRLKQKVNFKLKGIAYKLIYRATVDGEKEFHSHCNNCHQSLVIIKTTDGYRFGGYTKLDWSGRNIDKVDSFSFVFSLDYLKIYNAKKGKNSIFCDPEYGPCFSGAFYVSHKMLHEESELCLYNDSNFSGMEYDYEFTGNQFFYIDELEVFKVNFY